MEKLLERQSNGKFYTVYFDSIDYRESCEAKSFDFGNEEENQAYAKRFQDEELFSYFVDVNIYCECCKQYSKQGDSLGGLHEASEYDALEYYINTYESER